MVFTRLSKKTGYDVWGKNLETDEEFAIGVMDGSQSHPRITSDGRFVAFESRNARDESVILVKDLVRDETIAVANDVVKPRWDRPGAYLYFESEILGEVHRVAFDHSDGMHVGEPETMFSDARSLHTHWDIPPVRDTILLSAPSGSGNAGSDWKVVLNWAQTLER
jgi:hypothetical protein